MYSFVNLLRSDFFWIREYNSQTEYFEEVSQSLLEKGYVSGGFAQAVTRREAEYPTGLQLEMMGAAIPHAMPELVIQSGIHVTIFKNPIAFRRMDDPEREIQVEIAFMLLSSEKHAHVDVLASLFNFFQSPNITQALQATSYEEFLNYIEQGGE